MAEYRFERDCRTSSSEVYNILDGETPVGHVDLHYAPTLVHATLCIFESLTQKDIQELIDLIENRNKKHNKLILWLKRKIAIYQDYIVPVVLGFAILILYFLFLNSI